MTEAPRNPKASSVGKMPSTEAAPTEVSTTESTAPKMPSHSSHSTRPVAASSAPASMVLI